MCWYFGACRVLGMLAIEPALQLCSGVYQDRRRMFHWPYVSTQAVTEMVPS